MRRLLLSATALIAFGIAAASAKGVNPNQPNGTPPAQQGASPATAEGMKPTQDQSGSLLELTVGGKQPITLPNGERRGFLEDGDTLSLRGYCERAGAVRIGLGEVSGTVLAAA